VGNYNTEVGTLRANAGTCGIKAYSGTATKDPRPLYQRPYVHSEFAPEFPSLPGQAAGKARTSSRTPQSLRKDSDGKASAPRPKDMSGTVQDWTNDASVGANPCQSGPMPGRLAVLESVFSALDVDGDGHLNSGELLRFARLTGFDADPSAWREEYALLCKDAGISPSDGFNRRAFAAVVDDSSEHGCPCTKTELEDIAKKLCSIESSKAVPEHKARPEVHGAVVPPKSIKMSKAGRTGKQIASKKLGSIDSARPVPERRMVPEDQVHIASPSVQKDLGASTVDALPAAGSDDDCFWEECPEQPDAATKTSDHARMSDDTSTQNLTQALSMPSSAPTALEQTEHRTVQVNPGEACNEHASASRSQERENVKTTCTIPDDGPTRTNRFAKQLAREPLIESIFGALDLDRDGILCSEELRHFAELSGFDGGDEE
jgi:hypothetical protein